MTVTPAHPHQHLQEQQHSDSALIHSGGPSMVSVESSIGNVSALVREAEADATAARAAHAELLAEGRFLVKQLQEAEGQLVVEAQDVAALTEHNKVLVEEKATSAAQVERAEQGEAAARAAANAAAESAASVASSAAGEQALLRRDFEAAAKTWTQKETELTIKCHDAVQHAASLAVSEENAREQVRAAKGALAVAEGRQNDAWEAAEVARGAAAEREKEMATRMCELVDSLKDARRELGSCEAGKEDLKGNVRQLTMACEGVEGRLADAKAMLRRSEEAETSHRRREEERAAAEREERREQAEARRALEGRMKDLEVLLSTATEETARAREAAEEETHRVEDLARRLGAAEEEARGSSSAMGEAQAALAVATAEKGASLHRAEASERRCEDEGRRRVAAEQRAVQLTSQVAAAEEEKGRWERAAAGAEAQRVSLAEEVSRLGAMAEREVARLREQREEDAAGRRREREETDRLRGEVERGGAALKHARQEALETQRRAGAASEAVMVHARAAWGEETRRVVEEAERGASAKQEWVQAETQQRLAAMSGEKDRCVRKWALLIGPLLIDRVVHFTRC